MKYLFVFLVLLTACDSAENEPVYTDISGSWTFKFPEVSGSFSIAKAMDGKYYIDNGDFTFTGSAKNTITVKEPIQIDGFTIDSILLREKPAGNYLQFYSSGHIKSNYSEMRVKSYLFRNGTNSNKTILTDSLTISRR